MTSSTAPDTQTVCFAMPHLPGRTAVDREEMLACWHGQRSAEHTASRRRLGITRESAWLQPTPAGDLAVVLIEATDLGRAPHGIGTSTEPFDVWFREHVKACHGVDLTEGMTLPEAILDFRA